MGNHKTLPAESCRLPFRLRLPEGDSIEQYCRCPVTRGVCRRLLNINSFHCAFLRGFTLCSYAIGDRDVLTMQALLILLEPTQLNLARLLQTSTYTKYECGNDRHIRPSQTRSGALHKA